MYAREAPPADRPPHTITLAPLRADGPHALDTHDSPEIAEARLFEVEVLSEDKFHLTTIKRADDLFDLTDTTARAQPVIPQTGKLSRAIFSLRLANSDKPQKLELAPPHTIHFPSLPAPAPILEWLDKRHYRILAAIGHKTALLLLALASAFAPNFGDGDNDEDDCDSDRTHLRACI